MENIRVVIIIVNWIFVISATIISPVHRYTHPAPLVLVGALPARAAVVAPIVPAVPRVMGAPGPATATDEHHNTTPQKVLTPHPTTL